MSLKGKPHDLSIYYKSKGIVLWKDKHFFNEVQRPITLRVTGDLHDEWFITLSLVDEEAGSDAPMYQIHFDEILKEINRRIEIIEHSRLNRPE